MRPRREHTKNSSLDIIGIPKKFQEISLEDFKTDGSEKLEEVLDYVARYISHIGVRELKNTNGILFYGSNGVGKTMLASMILREAYMCRFSCKRMTFVEYIEMYTKAWGAKSTSEREDLIYELNTKAKSVQFLLLEEVGKEIDSKVAVPILEDLLRYREDNSLITIMCTNVKPSDLEERYGASIMSLMKGSMYPIRIVGRDRRADDVT